ncbi:MAG: Hsp20/alpha crystallin family protein [Chthoniobacterales bacterium]
MSIIRYKTPDVSLWRSFDRLANLRDEFNSLFDTPTWPPSGRQQLFSGWTPALDLYQTTDDVVAVLELPGMKKDDIEISLHDGMLTISGERKDESAEAGKDDGRTERFVGKFRRSITMPTRVDSSKVNASYKDGILTVTLPKAEEVKAKQIQITVD